MIIFYYLKYICYHKAHAVDCKRKYTFFHGLGMSILAFQSEIIWDWHIYIVEYVVDFEKGIILCDVEKGFSRLNFKGVSLVFDVGNSSHNLMPISHGKCLSTYQMTVCVLPADKTINITQNQQIVRLPLKIAHGYNLLNSCYEYII